MASGLKLNPHIAKELPTGQVQCLVCNTQVKPTVWTAHMNGRKHRDAIEKLKQSLAAPKRQAAPGGVKEPPAKKTKEEGPASSDSKKGDSQLPADFFDSATNTNNIEKTPWQQEKEEKEQIITAGKNLIEGVPHGFFDDRRKDLKVKDTLERNAVLDEEFDKFMREVNEEQSEEQRRAEEEAEREARMREIEHIDEQIAEWQRLNELEKLKEQRIAAAREKKEKQKQDEMDVENEEELDDDFDFSDWRKKKIL